MGASASISQNEDSNLLVNLYAECKKLEQECINSDITILKEQSKLTFKQKKVLIQLITNRSKDYLVKLVSQYGMKDYKLLVNDESLFGKFLILLAMPVIEIELEALQKSLGGIGINEVAVGILLSIKDTEEIKDLTDAFYKRYRCSLLSKLQTKIRKDTCNQTFFTTILSMDRDISMKIDMEAANTTVEKITPLLKSKSVEDTDTIITTLCSINREQCKVVADSYFKSNGSTLESAINAILPKSIATALNLWYFQYYLLLLELTQSLSIGYFQVVKLLSI